MKVLLLASYCDEEGCSDDCPCRDCLAMSNIASIPDDTPMLEILGGWDYIRDQIDQVGTKEE